MDVLSDVLRTIRLQGSLFLHGEFKHPWCVQTPGGDQLAGMLLPGVQQLAVCHFVLEGECWVQLPGGESRHLQTGDVAVFAQGDPHLLGSGMQLMPVRFDQVVQTRLPDLNCVRYGGDGARTLLVCGWFAFEQEMVNPFTATLPALFSASLASRPAGDWIAQSIRHALREATSPHAGSEAMAAKLAELLFVEALRAYIESLPPLQTGWLAGLRDPQIGQCLALLHADPARDWTVTELAQAVHMSRSVLAQRFAELVDMPPMNYLKQWRLSLAAGMLKNGRNSLARIAERIGYGSEAAFSRAFRQAYGMAPGQWRRGMTMPLDERVAAAAARLH